MARIQWSATPEHLRTLSRLLFGHFIIAIVLEVLVLLVNGWFDLDLNPADAAQIMMGLGLISGGVIARQMWKNLAKAPAAAARAKAYAGGQG